MSSRYFVTLAAIVFSLTLFLPQTHAQVVKATGNPTEASTQLIYYYDADDGNPGIQVTNTNDVEGVWIHVQIFRSFNAGTEEDPVIVLCDERDFFDFLTPNDTHIYTLSEENFPKNIGETEVNPGESTAINVDETQGFVVITPVVSNVDATAIAFEHMVGNAMDQSKDIWLNAMGRSAVDLSTGQKLADGTPLDGVTTGFQLLQPAELIFDFAGTSDDLDIVAIVFEDVYGEPGLLGYQISPSTATWTTFIFDFKESPTSCGIRQINCYASFGLNETFGQNNTQLNPGTEDLLCAGSITPEYPDGAISPDEFGWTRIFVSGLEGNSNMIGVYFNDDSFDGARWMNTNVQ